MTLPLRARLAALALVTGLSLSAVAQAADRSPAQRQSLVELAYVLGQSHALRQACQGQADQFWRQRMYRLIETEQPDQGLDRRLKEAFNAGYAAAQNAYPTCSAQSRAAAERAADHGRSLAESLAEP